MLLNPRGMRKLPDFCRIFLCMVNNTTHLASVGLAQTRPNYYIYCLC